MSTTAQNSDAVQTTSRAFWGRIAKLDRSISPITTINKLRSHTFKVADFALLFPFAWVLVCLSIVGCSQAQSFPFLSTITTAILYTGGLTIPLINQFLFPATPILLYIWTIFYFRRLPPDFPQHSIRIPLHLTSLTHPLLAASLWLFQSSQALRFHVRLVGYANLSALALFLLPSAMWYPHASTAPPSSHHGYQGAFAGLNTGLQMFAIAQFFPQLSWAGVGFGILCVWQGASRDFLSFLLGVCAATSFFYFQPRWLKKEDGEAPSQTESLPLTRATIDSTEKDPETRMEVSSVAAPTIELEHSNQLQLLHPPPSSATHPPVDVVSNGHAQNVQTKPPIEVARSERGATSDQVTSNGDVVLGSTNAESSTQHSSIRRRQSAVHGPRPPRRNPRPTSIDMTSEGRVVTSSFPLLAPAPMRTPPIIPPSRRLTPMESRGEEESPFETLVCLGRSSNRVANQVRDRKTQAVYVRKTFYPRETTGHHIKVELDALAERQRSHEACANLVRCFKAYPPVASGEVEAIFEYCEGGSLLSLGSKMTERNWAIGERIVRRIAGGMLQGLVYLHSHDIVHLNIKPSNVLLTRLGVVKLSEPEIPGEGAMALTDTAMTSLVYAAPERFLSTQGSDRTRSDVWSMGITLLEFVQNQCPFPSDLPIQVLMCRIIEQDPPQLQDQGEVIRSSEMKDFFRQMLVSNPAVRPSARNLLQHLWIPNVNKRSDSQMEKWVCDVHGWPYQQRTVTR